MSILMSAPVLTLGQYDIRKVTNTAWAGQYVVVRSADQDVLSVHGSRDAAFAKMADFDCGLAIAETKAERLAKLAPIPSDTLTELLSTLDPYRDWKAVRDIKATIAAR